MKETRKRGHCVRRILFKMNNSAGKKKKRNKVSNQEQLHWLFAGTPTNCSATNFCFS